MTTNEYSTESFEKTEKSPLVMLCIVNARHTGFINRDFQIVTEISENCVWYNRAEFIKAFEHAKLIFPTERILCDRYKPGNAYQALKSRSVKEFERAEEKYLERC